MHRSLSLRITHLVRVLCVAALMCMGIFMLFGCDGDTSKQRVTVSVWDDSLLDSAFTQKIEELNPEYSIIWISGEDSAEFYEFQGSNGSMPDVVLTTSLSESDTEITESLCTLDETDLAQNQDQAILSAIPGNSEEVKWIPASSPYTGIIVNQYLFELYDIALPTDKASLQAACKAFAEQGVEGLAVDGSSDATLFSFMETVCSDIPFSETGQSWRSNYRSGIPSRGLDASVWTEPFEELDALVSSGYVVLHGQDAEQTAYTTFMMGEAAMLFVDGEDIANYGDGYNMTVQALPNFSDAGNWVLAEPVFYGAVSAVQAEGVKTDQNDIEVRAQAIEVLESIMSDEGQQAYFETCGLGDRVSMERMSNRDHDEAYDLLDNALAGGGTALGISDAQIRSAVATAARKELAGDFDDAEGADETAGDGDEQGSAGAGDGDGSGGTETSNAATSAGLGEQSLSAGLASGIDVQDGDAYSAVAEAARASAEEDLTATIKEDTLVRATFAEGMSNVWDSESGNMVASAVAQTLQADLDCDFAIVSGRIAQCPLYRGDMTATELAYPVASTPVYTVELTGAQIQSLVAAQVSSVGNGSSLLALSGLRMTLSEQDGSYSLVSLERMNSADGSATPAGQSEHVEADTSELDLDATYTVALSFHEGDMLSQAVAQVAEGADLGLRQNSQTLRELWCAHFTSSSEAQQYQARDYLDFV